MGIDAALADQLQLRQPFQQGRADLRALADQHQRLGVAQALGEPVDVLDMVVPDRHLMTGKLAEAIERAQRVEIIVEDGDLHAMLPWQRETVTSPPAIRHRTSAWRSAE